MKKGGHVLVYGEEKKDKKDEKKGGHADTFGDKKDTFRKILVRKRSSLRVDLHGELSAEDRLLLRDGQLLDARVGYRKRGVAARPVGPRGHDAPDAAKPLREFLHALRARARVDRDRGVPRVRSQVQGRQPFVASANRRLTSFQLTTSQNAAR